MLQPIPIHATILIYTADSVRVVNWISTVGQAATV